MYIDCYDLINVDFILSLLDKSYEDIFNNDNISEHKKNTLLGIVNSLSCVTKCELKFDCRSFLDTRDISLSIIQLLNDINEILIKKTTEKDCKSIKDSYSKIINLFNETKGII